MIWLIFSKELFWLLGWDKGRREISREVSVIIEVVFDGFFSQSGSNGGGELWSDSRSTVKAELVEFAERFNMRFKRESQG